MTGLGSEGNAMDRPYVLGFEPILKEKVWGGRRLERYGKRLEAGRSYGESWELADLGSTAVSGGGGGAARSVIDRGPMAGRTIGEAIRAWGADLLGDAVWARVSRDDGPAFPLLVKFLDAREHLSVQVHPSPAFAAAHDWAHLKTESWLVMEAEEAVLPGGVTEAPAVFKGIEGGVGSAAFSGSIRAGDVARHLSRHAAVAGECHTLPSGTCHALGGGVLVLEVQTPSDTTFRVYDWAGEYGRGGRELHVEDAMACIEFGADGGQAAPAAVRAGGANGSVVAETDWYRIHAVTCEAGASAAFVGGGCRVVVGLEGAGGLVADGATSELEAGRTLLVPASVREAAVSGGSDGLRAAVVEVL